MSEIDGVPYVAIGADELGDPARVGDVIDCDICGGSHALEALATIDGQPTDMLLTYCCGDQTYVAALDGRYIIDRFRAFREQEKAGDV